jgi:hypothetical protein
MAYHAALCFASALAFYSNVITLYTKCNQALGDDQAELGSQVITEISFASSAEIYYLGHRRYIVVAQCTVTSLLTRQIF